MRLVVGDEYFIMRLIGKKIIILIVIFLIINLSWYLVVNMKYHKFVEVVPVNNFGNHIHREDGYLYSVRKPDYLRLQGNLFISKDDVMSLNIFPLIFGGYEYHFSINDEGKSYEFYLNRYFEPINNDGYSQSNEVKQFKNELEELLTKANEMWNLEN